MSDGGEDKNQNIRVTFDGAIAGSSSQSLRTLDHWYGLSPSARNPANSTTTFWTILQARYGIPIDLKLFGT